LALPSLASLKLERIRDKKHIVPNYSLKKFAPVEEEAGVNEIIQASKLWEDRCAIIIVVSRPGCPFCREQAHRLCQRVEEISQLLDFSVDEQSFNLVAIVKSKDEEDMQEFYDYFTTSVQADNSIFGNVFFDADKGFYKKMRKMSAWEFLTRSFWKRYREVQRKYKGSDKYENLTLGGLLVVSKEKIWYEFREKTIGDPAPLEEVLRGFEAATALEVDRIRLNCISSDPGAGVGAVSNCPLKGVCA
jgi:hypothetical protein